MGAFIKNFEENPKYRMLTILAYLHYHPGYEGRGGMQAILHGGNWRKGTRLRARGGPLYEVVDSERLRYLNKLCAAGALRVYKVIGEDKSQVKCYCSTELGLETLQKILPWTLIEYTAWYTFVGRGITWYNKRYVLDDPNKWLEHSGGTPGSNYGYIVDKVHDPLVYPVIK